MKLLATVLSIVSVVSAFPNAYTPSTFSQRVIFTPPSDYKDPRVLYARTALLTDGSLLATWENYSPEPPQVSFPIYHSTDGGYTWAEISRVQDTAQGWGLRYQPFLYVLPANIAGYKAGTVLLAGNSIPTDLSRTQIDLYASEDMGVTWQFVSHIAAGGEALPNNGLTPVWEPFLMLNQQTLICYYSDQRDNTTHAQKLVHQTTTDLKNWGPVVDDVDYSNYTDRPGMATVAELPNGKFIMTYEFGGGPAIPSSYQFPIYYKIASDPEQFGSVEGTYLKWHDGTIPTGSPYVIWSQEGGANGTIFVSADSNAEVFINKNLGTGHWTKVATPEISSYSRSLRVLTDPTKLLIIGAGQTPPTTSINKVQLSVMDISKL